MFWLLRQIIYCVFIIVLSHYFYNYLKDTMTTPIIKSVSVQKNDLEDIAKKTDISVVPDHVPDNVPDHVPTSKDVVFNDKTHENKISEMEENEMKQTLKMYIKQLNSSSSNTLSTTNINSLP